MRHDINEGNIKWIVTRLNSAIGDGQFTTGEAVIGAAEFIGRLIVSLANNPVSGFQAAEVMEQHIKRTLVAGYAAQGFNMGEQE